MISPELAGPAPVNITENLANGNGYWYALPESPAPLAEGLEAVGQYGTFNELSTIVDMGQANGSVLVQGAPGAGKSHLVRELQTGCVVNDVACFCLTVHVNGGKASGVEVMNEQLGTFREAVQGTGGVVILDNVDYVGYRGSSRTRSASRRYAEGLEATVADLAADPSIVTIATGHNEAWREGRWTWNDPAIDEPAARIMEQFDSQLVFEGGMSLVGLAHVMSARGFRLGQAARTIRALKYMDRANFFHANHVDPGVFEEDPVAAIAQIEAGRRERIAK
ncbi:MAG TPA: AAA family ATPase [Candidatus Saccharimonadales bacterium]|jgi:hypothetical protein|nr:AAA family ATPase [Candidatus Saccharimonadales bacterium]